MIYQGDCLDILPILEPKSVQCCVTSPPYYGLRDYGCEGQIGLEETPEAYVAKLVAVFREVRRVLADDGTLWLNLGDSYANNKDGNTQGSSTSGLHYTNPNKDLEQFRNEQQFKKRVEFFKHLDGRRKLCNSKKKKSNGRLKMQPKTGAITHGLTLYRPTQQSTT